MGPAEPRSATPPTPGRPRRRRSAGAERARVALSATVVAPGPWAARGYGTRTPGTSAPGEGVPGIGLVPVGGRIALFRALPGIGDLLCAVPAMRAIRAARPDVVVTLVTLPAVLDLAGRFGRYLDEVVPFPGFPGLPDRRPDVPAIPGFLAAMHDRRFDLAIQLHGAGDRTNDIVRLLGARRTAGFHPRGDVPPEGARYLPWLPEERETDRWLRLVAHLGWPAPDATLELPLAADADAQLDAALAEADPTGLLTGPFAVVHPGASAPERRWPGRCFAEVVDRLTGVGLAVALTGGARESAITALVRSLAARPERIVDLAGRTSLDALGALLRRSALLVANDTGVAHVADALGTPSVVVYTGSDPARWAAEDTVLHRALSGGSARRVGDEALRLLRRGRPDGA